MLLLRAWLSIVMRVTEPAGPKNFRMTYPLLFDRIIIDTRAEFSRKLRLSAWQCATYCRAALLAARCSGIAFPGGSGAIIELASFAHPRYKRACVPRYAFP